MAIVSMSEDKSMVNEGLAQMVNDVNVEWMGNELFGSGGS